MNIWLTGFVIVSSLYGREIGTTKFYQNGGFRQVVKIDHFFSCGLWEYRAMKQQLSPKQILAVRCPTCGAAPGKKCELATGLPRTEPHRDRRVIAKDEP
ncbi:MAG: hypothetical protein WB683_12645 [Candidatus Sulfotelmatobacter sp.]